MQPHICSSYVYTERLRQRERALPNLEHQRSSYSYCVVYKRQTIAQSRLILNSGVISVYPYITLHNVHNGVRNMGVESPQPYQHSMAHSINYWSEFLLVFGLPR